MPFSTAGGVVHVNRNSLFFEMWDNLSDTIEQNTFHFFFFLKAGFRSWDEDCGDGKYFDLAGHLFFDISYKAAIMH